MKKYNSIQEFFNERVPFRVKIKVKLQFFVLDIINKIKKMNNKKVIKAMRDNNLKVLKEEAIRRGYIAGAKVVYFSDIPSILGDGKFDIYKEDDELLLIKRDGVRFDVLFNKEDGWTKFIN